MIATFELNQFLMVLLLLAVVIWMAWIILRH